MWIGNAFTKKLIIVIFMVFTLYLSFSRRRRYLSEVAYSERESGGGSFVLLTKCE